MSFLVHVYALCRHRLLVTCSMLRPAQPSLERGCISLRLHAVQFKMHAMRSATVCAVDPDPSIDAFESVTSDDLRARTTRTCVHQIVGKSVRLVNLSPLSATKMGGA